MVCSGGLQDKRIVRDERERRIEEGVYGSLPFRSKIFSKDANRLFQWEETRIAFADFETLYKRINHRSSDGLRASLSALPDDTIQFGKSVNDKIISSPSMDKVLEG